MKKLILFALLAIVAGLQSMKAQEAYACYTSENTTLTFYYDNLRSSRTGTTYDLPKGTSDLGWISSGTYTQVTKVAFDASFANARPTTTHMWFFDMENLRSITGMEYLNTSEVTDMEGMFWNCKVLTSLDLSSFNTAQVTKMGYMFINCEKLTTIYVSEGWSTAAVTSSGSMFEGCTKLVGGAGTTYDANHVDASYAHIDGGTSNPGYLSSRPWDFMVDGIWYKDVGYGFLAVTYKDENYFSYSGDVVIPESVTTDVWCYTVSTIGERAFYRCPYLQNLTIPASVDRIEVEAFYDAFFDAINSTVTCLAQTPPSISPLSFDYAIESMTLYVPVGTMTAYRSHSVWGQFASIVELPYSFVVNGIYYKITGDGTVSVTYRDANYNCYSGNVVIPATVTSDGVTYTVTAIEASAFFNCADLTAVTIPETVTQIGFNAFQGCTALEEGNITCLATTPPTIQSNTFGTWHYKGASLYVPYGCYDAYASANYWKNFSDIYELEEFIEYSLWIAGTQVTSWNKGNVLGDGHVSYDVGTNTLTLNGADISSESDYGIKSQLAGLNINVQGQNTVTAGSADGIYLHATGTATIFGSGSLDVSSSAAAGIHAYQDLVLKDGVKVTVNSKGSYGVRGTKLKRTSPLPTLTMQGQETMLTAKGGNTSSSVAFFHALTLSDGLEILEPEGAEFLEDVGIVNSGGTVATFSKVVIGYPALPEPEAYACYTSDNTTLTFYYDYQRSSREGTTYDLSTGIPAWYNDGTNASVTKAVFDASFANALLTSTYAWFAGMVNLQSITGMEYLNTSEVTSMGYMFYYCPSLTSLDLNHFDTSKVTDMYAMFYYCPSLTSLDLSSFNTANVTYMYYMFYYCPNLKTIYVGEGWSTAAVTNSGDMFYACESLVGGQGTVVDENHTDASYAHIDGGTSNPGYFTAEGAEPWSGPEAYACYTPGNTTLTFFYDTQRDSRTGTTYSLNMGSYGPGWYNGETNASVTKVVFDASFANVRPTSTTSWFEGMENLQSIVGMEYLNTSEVKYMDFMFAGCTSLTSLDISHFNTDKVTRMDGMFYNCEKFTSLNLSHFNTSNVTNMSGMFSGCESLTSLDVSNFNTGKVTNMSYMFRDCKLVTNLDVSSFNTENITSMESMFNDCDALTSLDLSNFNTGKVTNMSTMFWSCNNLTSVDLSSFNTSNVTDMSMMFASCQALKNLNLSNFNTANVTKMNRMFDSCIGLTSLDLSSFNTAKVTNMNWMFWNCVYLETIYVGEGWSTAAVTDSDDMFEYCDNLVGGQGTTYDADHVDASYAHIDEGTSNPGYFTAEGAEPWDDPAYACYTPENTTLTFYYDNQRDSRTGTTYDLNKGNNNPGWYDDETCTNVTKVVFDPSFANARPTSTLDWFGLMENLQSIEGIEYLNTSKVTNMGYMFYACTSLTSLDVSHFNTSKVTSMRQMFCNCPYLTSLDVSSFNTTKVTNMRDMFAACPSLTSLDLSSFNTSQVTNMNSMFKSCIALKAIYVGDDWSTAAVTDSEDMFYDCTRLVGGAGTTYDENHVDASYAHIDGGTSNPGYFTEFATYELWIAGTQVTSANKDDVLGDGTVSYNPETNTLTLNNANISANGTYGIRSVSPNININLIGRNNVEVVDGQGVSTTNRDGGTVTISGGGELNIKASDVAFATNCEVVFQDGVQIKAESTGSFGMEGSKARAARFYPAIKMLGSETVLMAKGGTGAITHFRILNLNNGIKILEPAGTTFVSNDGILITNEWVVIANQDYIDGISLTPSLSKGEGEWYDLQGRKLDKITQPGIYIKDGKKIIRK